MLNIGKFIARIRRWLLMECVEWEIYHKIFPHLNHAADYGYSFFTSDEILAQNVREHCKLEKLSCALEAAAAKMPEAYGQAFRNIAYRDINGRMEEYIRLAKQREYYGPEKAIPETATV